MTDTRLPTGTTAEQTVSPRLILLRSLYPIVALGILLGTTLWGPWVSLLLVAGWWNVVTRVA
jgi:hypothetical protein